jgi:peptidylprolyl isomerase
MPQAKNGDNVQVHYKGTLTDGTLFDSSEGREPLSFPLGAGMVIAGFDNGVMGMEIGEKKRIEIPADQAYGPQHTDLIFSFNRADIPNDVPVEIGGTLEMHEDGNPQSVPVIIRQITGDTIVVDANHPLAGEDLIFEVELVSIG